MKIKGEFVMRQVLDEYILVPVNDTAARFSGIISLNAVSAFIWKEIEKGTDKKMILENLLREFEVDRETAAADMEEFLQTLREKDLLANE